MELKAVSKFIYELGQLRRVKHEGWRLAGVSDPDSVAEHSLRVAQIGYILAVLEKHPAPAEVAAIGIFHDIEECRIGDVHKVANRYVTADKERAVRDQTEPLGELGAGILKLWLQDHRRDTAGGVIAKDADLLEMAAMAKEYLERGFASAQDWLNNISPALKTESARRLFAALSETGSTEWWQGLKKLS